MHSTLMYVTFMMVGYIYDECIHVDITLVELKLNFRKFNRHFH
jgi:hypothetical protein